MRPLTTRPERERAARWRAGVLLAWVLALGLAGCGASVVYPRLDTLVGLYIRGLVSLDESQSARLARTLEHNLAWHRRDELERYEAFLRELAARVAGGLTRHALEDAALRAETYWRRIFEQAAPGYTDLAATLTDRQVRELLQNLERADEKTWREHTQRTSEQRFKDRDKSVRRHVERMTGPLDTAQRSLISDYAWGARPFMFEWRDNRRRWREELEATLRLRTGPREAFAARMRVLIAEPDSLWTPEYRQALATSRAELLDLVLQLDATLTPQQRARAQQRLLALAEEMRGLALRRG